MDPYLIFTQLESIGNLLVLASSHRKQEDLSFAQSQGVKPLPRFGNNFGLFVPGSIAIDCSIDCIKQLLLAAGLGQELDSPHPIAVTDRECRHELHALPSSSVDPSDCAPRPTE
jgi:hypothetical protein